MKKQTARKLHDLYHSTLVKDVVPFWLEHSLDHEYGGYLHYLDRDGSVFSEDKGMWLQCREAWLFSKLYNDLEPRREWLDAANIGYDFVMKHGFDVDGRMFFEVTRDGRPLRKRRYFFSEMFAVMAFIQYYRATRNEQALQRANDTYNLVLRLFRNPDSTTPPKVFPQARDMKSLSYRMMMICISQEMKTADSNPLYEEVINDSIYQILNQFLKREKRALLETVGPNGEFLDCPEGRLICPGHSIEVAWFVLHEGMDKKDSSLISAGLDILDWSLKWGWDRKYGGLFYYVDLDDRPPLHLEWDMKLWWVHTEAMYALLLAHYVTRKQKYLDWYEKVHRYSFGHFPDRKYGEWFAYLHRDGTLASRLKGSLWKGPFHLSRFLLQGVKLTEKLR